MNKKSVIRIILAAIAVALIFAGGCSPADKSYDETVSQVSTIDALLTGVYDGVMTFDELAEYGDFGIGTFAGLDGEMLAFDGKFWQVKADGVAYEVSGDMETPFAAVTFFEADESYDIAAGTDFDGLKAFLDARLPMLNAFHAIRIDGTFSYMKTRSVPGQQKPYPPLAEVTANQPEFEFTDVTGTIVGFRCPDYVAGVNVTGYHLHFLSADETGGGHILDFTVAEASAGVDVTAEFLMILPDASSDFYAADLSQDRQEELEQVEK